MSKNIFITGASSGFGRALASVASAEGHTVVGTVRKEADRAAFEAIDPARCFARLLDVTDTAAIAPLVAEVEASVGPIEVLFNNAGFGYQGTVEETPLADLRHQFEVNVFGAVAVIQAVLPYMRKRRAGHILNVTSMGGFITFPGLGIYHGSKFALEGLSETLAKEVKALGIRVTAVEPGGFRTDWAGRSMKAAPRSIPDYDEVAEGSRTRLAQRNGKQPGDPLKAARVLLDLVAHDDPPMHLLLGSDAVELVSAQLDGLKAGIETWVNVSMSTNFE